jgi:hypothetical protein
VFIRIGAQLFHPLSAPQQFYFYKIFDGKDAYKITGFPEGKKWSNGER